LLFSGILLAAVIGLLAPVAAVIAAHLLFGDEPGDAGAAGRDDGRRGPVDPNEAARAAGSWG
jgi:hypothetical protein